MHQADLTEPDMNWIAMPCEKEALPNAGDQVFIVLREIGYNTIGGQVLSVSHAGISIRTARRESYHAFRSILKFCLLKP